MLQTTDAKGPRRDECPVVATTAPLMQGHSSSSPGSGQREASLPFVSLMEQSPSRDVLDETISLSSDSLLFEELCPSADVESMQTGPASADWAGEGSSASLVISDVSGGGGLRETVESVVVNHAVDLCRLQDAFALTNAQPFQLIWLHMPVSPSHDVLSLTTSIRYASKLNKSTVIVGVTEASPDVDLRLHGIDEVVLEPVSRAVVRQKYSKWTSVSLQPLDDSEQPPSVETPSTPGSTISNESVRTDFSHTTSSSGSSQQSGSGIAVGGTGGTLDPQGSVGGLAAATQTLTYQQALLRNPQALAMCDHTTKEKLRRERIKDSCDQLRVLLPYIRGRKTDMASILEMTVDYLKIVNAALPTDFQNQITSFMSKTAREPGAMKGTGGRGGRRGRRSQQPPESPSTGKVSSTMESSCSSLSSSSGVFDLTGGHGVFVPSPRTSTPHGLQSAPTKRDAKGKPVGGSLSLAMTSPSATSTSSAPSSMIFLPGECPPSRKDPQEGAGREEGAATLAGAGGHAGGQQQHIYVTDLDAASVRMYPTSGLQGDAYGGLGVSAHAPMGTSPGGQRMALVDREGYGMYGHVDSAFYHYYGGQHAGATGYGSGGVGDHGNATGALPAAYSSRSGVILAAPRKFPEDSAS